jgi:cytidylate kinase
MGVITISRGSYSRGKEIAEKLAEKLAYTCVSREILLQTSEEFNVSEAKLLNAIQSGPSIFERVKFGKKKYIAFIQKVFFENILKDNVVYHGFAGQFFTQDIPHILKVRIIADFDYRIKRVMKKENIDEHEAEKMLLKIDSERAKWSMFLHGIDTTSPELYDIILHIDQMNVDDAVQIISDLSMCACFKNVPETDATIKDKLLAVTAYLAIIDKYPDANVKSRDRVVTVILESSLSLEQEIHKEIKDLLASVEEIKEVRLFVIPLYK